MSSPSIDSLIELPYELIVECLLFVPGEASSPGNGNAGGTLPSVFRLARVNRLFQSLVPRTIYQLIKRGKMALVLLSDGPTNLFHLQLFAKSFDERRNLIEFAPWQPWMGKEPAVPAWMDLPAEDSGEADDAETGEPAEDPIPLAIEPEVFQVADAASVIALQPANASDNSRRPRRKQRTPGLVLFPKQDGLNSARLWFEDFAPNKEKTASAPLLPGNSLHAKEAVQRAAAAFHKSFNLGLDRIFVIPDPSSSDSLSGTATSNRLCGDRDVLVSFEDSDAGDEFSQYRALNVNSVKVSLGFLSLGYGYPSESRWLARSGLLRRAEEVDFERGMARHGSFESSLWDWADEPVLRYLERVIIASESSDAAATNTIFGTSSRRIPHPPPRPTSRALLFHFLRNPGPSSGNGTTRGKDPEPPTPHPTHVVYKYSFAKRFLTNRVVETGVPELAPLVAGPQQPGYTTPTPHQHHLSNPALAVAHAIIKSERAAAGVFWSAVGRLPRDVRGDPRLEMRILRREGEEGGWNSVSWWGAVMRWVSVVSGPGTDGQGQ